MTDSTQHIIGNQILAECYLYTPHQIIDALNVTVKGWNQAPTPF